MDIASALLYLCAGFLAGVFYWMAAEKFIKANRPVQKPREPEPEPDHDARARRLLEKSNLL